MDKHALAAVFSHKNRSKLCEYRVSNGRIVITTLYAQFPLFVACLEQQFTAATIRCLNVAIPCSNEHASTLTRVVREMRGRVQQIHRLRNICSGRGMKDETQYDNFFLFLIRFY